MKTDLLAMDLEETRQWVEAIGLEAYRAAQIRQWIFKGLAGSFQEMTSLSKDARLSLEQGASLHVLEGKEIQVSKDGTRKYLFRLHDDHLIESVLIPERSHFTLCISSQAGCAMGCRFCLTGKQGFKRNLSPSEIIDQVIQVRRSIAEPDRLTNLVLMGMGEPLANYDAVAKAARNLVDLEGMNFSNRRVTLSTCGLVPQILRLGKDVTINLAVSLNAADNETRDFLMPINRTYPLETLMAACREFPLSHGKRITFEYILIQGVNDRREDAVRLSKLLSGIKAKINLIPLNPHEGLDLSPPTAERMLAFQQILIDRQFTVMIRKSKGTDISAACGQLAGKARAKDENDRYARTRDEKDQPP
jgi:23S rRNA (adenine2503-C2)-methyltransferase